MLNPMARTLRRPVVRKNSDDFIICAVTDRVHRKWQSMSFGAPRNAPVYRSRRMSR